MARCLAPSPSQRAFYVVEQTSSAVAAVAAVAAVTTVAAVTVVDAVDDVGAVGAMATETQPASRRVGGTPVPPTTEPKSSGEADPVDADAQHCGYAANDDAAGPSGFLH